LIHRVVFPLRSPESKKSQRKKWNRAGFADCLLFGRRAESAPISTTGAIGILSSEIN
jgi:hypothetical protein